MEWDESKFGITYFGAVPLDTSTPPVIGNVVSLASEGFDFNIEINSIEGTLYIGTVKGIDPAPEVEALGIQTGQKVTFDYKNIKSLVR